MRKTIKFTLLLALVTLLLAVTALAISASPTAPTGSTVRDDTHAFVVTNNNKNYYYTTLEEATADVPANGIITLLRNATVGGTYVEGDHPVTTNVEAGYIAALSLSRDATYTIDGNGFSLFLSPGYSLPSSNASVDTSVALHITAGHITFKNLSFHLSNASSANVGIYLQNPKRTVGSLSLTLDNVQMTFKTKYSIWSHQQADVTIKGDKTLISGASNNALRIQSGAGASTYTLEGGRVTSKGYGIYLGGTGSTFIQTGGSLFALDAISLAANANYLLSNGTVKLGSGGSLFVLDSNADASATLTTTITGGKLVVQDTASVPSYSNIDTSSLALYWAPEYVTLTASATFDALSDWTTLVAKVTPSISASAFKSVTYATIAPLLIPTGITLKITAGTYASPFDTMSTLLIVQGGKLTITGGTLKNTNPFGTIITVDESYTTSTSSVTVSGGTFYATKNLLNVTEGTIPSAISLKTCLIIMNENADRVIASNAVALDKITYTGLTVLSKVNCVIAENITLDVKNSRLLFGGTAYGAYFQSAPTSSTLDVSNSDTTYSGASVYITEAYDQSGIRFITVLSPEVIATLKTKSGTLSFGTIIAPLDYVIKAGAFTVNALSALSVSGTKYEKIPAVNSIRDTDGDGIPESYSAALINLKTKNYTRAFAAISYVEIGSQIYYGAFTTTENARSIQDVARKSLKTVSDFTSDQVTSLKSYAGYTKDATKTLSLTWTSGAVTAASHKTPLQVISQIGYIYSDIIHIEKAGTAISFVDPNNTIAADNFLVISRWKQDGSDFVLDTAATHYSGADEAVVTNAYSQGLYAYVSNEDNEYIRITCRQTAANAPTVYMDATNEPSTVSAASALKQKVTSFTINGVDLSSFQIVLKNSYTMAEWYTGLYLKNMIYESAWVSLPLVTASEATSTYQIQLGTDASQVTTTHGFASRVKSNVWYLNATSVVGYAGLRDYCANNLFSGVSTTVALTNAHLYNGDGSAFGSEPVECTGSLRILFNNIWGGTEHSITNRVKSMVELYAAYSPDIIGLQECSPDMRNAGMKSGLTALGYSEVPSPSGQFYYGSETITRNPIFYNPDTVTLLKYGYVSLANIDFGKYPELMGDYTEAQLSELAVTDGSKAVTWAIFKARATGDIFLVGSVHLWWESDAISDVIRTIQMREMREVMTATATSYMNANALLGSIPIIVGGDYNSNTSRPSFATMSEGAKPFTDLNDLVTDPAHKLTLATSHGYPSWNVGLGMWQHSNKISNAYTYAIDHIFCSADTSDLITVNHMGMLTDMDLAFMSDHSPIFADLTFHTQSTLPDPDTADDPFDSEILGLE